MEYYYKILVLYRDIRANYIGSDLSANAQNDLVDDLVYEARAV